MTEPVTCQNIGKCAARLSLHSMHAAMHKRRAELIERERSRSDDSRLHQQLRSPQRACEEQNMKQFAYSILVLTGLAALPIVACSSSSDSGAGSGGATTGGAAHAGASSAGTAGGGAAGSGVPAGGSGGDEAMAGSGGETDGAPEAPMIKSVEPLEGALHVMWMNMTKDCDKVVLLRSKDGGDYAIAYTLSGAADSQHDTMAIAPGEYCYKARCIKGDQTSPDSDPKCGKP